MDYYNEIDGYAADWLENLILCGLLPDGVVDRRSVVDIRPSELLRYRRCHFFAGIGVWALALEQAGWPADRRVWTGSCPCQPFSAAGRGGGFDDERHLWPAWQHLIDQCHPPVVLGEQVASKAVDPWVDLVQDDLEALGHAFGAVAFPAASVGAPHIRDRCYWVADSSSSTRLERWPRAGSAGERAAGPDCVAGSLADDDESGLGEQRSVRIQRADVHDADGRGSDGLVGGAGMYDRARRSSEADGDREEQPAGSSASGFWSAADWIPCRDGKWRPVEPGTFPLAHGASARVGRLRAYGNAIVAPQAEVWIRTVMECL